MPAQADRWTVDFSCALHNRTGKFFIGRDLIADQTDLIDTVQYWRVPLRQPPAGITAKVIGRLMAIEHKMRLRLPSALKAASTQRTPILHTDPFSVLHRGAAPCDVVICHDVGPLTHTDLFAPQVTELYRRVYELIAASGCRVAFVSEASRAAFAAMFGTSSHHVLIYPPLRSEVARPAASAVPQVSGPFLLTVGSLGRRKNQALSIGAFARSGLAARGFSYVLTGSREPGWEQVLAAAEQTPGVVLLDYVTDEALAWLYGNAAGFVLASRLEGFGIPVAEAIAAGLVPAVTANSVLTEVAGEGALAIDPDNADSIAEAMQHLAMMGEEERTRRAVLLSQSVRRFTRDRFRAAWRALLQPAGAIAHTPVSGAPARPNNQHEWA
ncbi:MAG: hypothetical protein B7Z39_00655 [Novosphingobium sp. 12-64-8]|nr:MAG: hypothetical protein B7Z39_00655 [Novosphingobium sp. 12-64-8]